MNNKKIDWRFILKIVGASLAFAGAVCAVVGYWTELMASACAAREVVKAKRLQRHPAEYDDYADDELM